MPRVGSVDPSLLQAALEGLELQRKRLDDQIRHVQSLLGKSGAASSSAAISISADGEKPVKRLLSADARKRIAAAQKRRWAAYRAAKKGGQASA